MRAFAFLALVMPAMVLSHPGYLTSGLKQYNMRSQSSRNRPLSFGTEGDDNPSEKTIAQVISEDERFNSMNKLMKSSRGLRDDLDNPHGMQWTMFAPVNEAFDRFNESDEFKPKQLLGYHLTSDAVLSMNDLRDGQIISTELREKGLKGDRQILRVTVRDNQVFVNLMAHVEFEVATANGKILAIDRVLVPPANLFETLNRLPIVFSTLVAGLFHTKLNKMLAEEKAVTLMAPDNHAWESLEYGDIFYLFSKEGEADLKRVLKYHVIASVEYTTRMREEGTVTLKTLNGGRKITINARHGSPRAGDDQRTLRVLGFAGIDGWDIDDPTGWEYDVNENEAKISFADAPAENGVIHLLNAVLIPDNVMLPSKSL